MAERTVSGRSLRDEIEALGPWFHNLHLPDGTATCPDHPYGDFPAFKWRELAPHIPRDLTGWTALDIGCNAGFYSFELARRGAVVTGIDREELYLDQARWAARRYGLQNRVTFERLQVHDLARDRRRFDLVLFMGVFYHLRYAPLALDTLARMRPRLLVFQTLMMPPQPRSRAVNGRIPGFDHPELDRVTGPEWPKVAFVEDTFGGDPTVWWMPDDAAVEALLATSGLNVIASANRETFICEPGPARPEWEEEEWRAATGVMRP